jgi:DNA-binding Lrp family transcriptional regulator
VIAPWARGGGITVLVAVDLSEHTRAALVQFERAVARSWQVRECHNVTGAFAYILRVEVPDLAAYKEFHTEVLASVPLVRQLTSFVVLSSPKDDRG